MTAERPLLAIGYKYNYRKVLSLVSTVGAGSTTLYILYLSNYPDKLSNVSIHPVAHLHIMCRFFGSVN